VSCSTTQVKRWYVVIERVSRCVNYRKTLNTESKSA